MQSISKSNNRKVENLNDLNETSTVSKSPSVKRKRSGINPDQTTSAANLIEDVSRMTGIPKSKVGNVLEAFKVALLHEVFESKKKVVLRRFGTFEARQKKPRNKNLKNANESTNNGKTKTYNLKFKCSRMLTYKPDKDY